MKVIHTGRNFSICDDSLKTYDTLPVGVYTIRFSQFKGFYLEQHAPMEVKESKIYGVHQEKVDKVLSSFDAFNRSLGVILSGDKGIGKSMFARLLSIDANKKGLPLILVEEYIPGIASFIEEIEQEVVVLFDEFDKTFANGGGGDKDPQATLLGLFDGISQGKKLFVITCNELRMLNDYLINRPGRFHYHFRFEYPSAEEIKEYLLDKLDDKYYGQIDPVVAFSRKVDLNYDCLRAIAFELNLGTPFEEAIKDLNILNVNSERYDLYLHFENGEVHENKGRAINFFGAEEKCGCYLYDQNGNDIIGVEFRSTDATYDSTKMAMVVPKNRLKLKYDENYSDEAVAKAKALVPEMLIISRQKSKNLHYLV